MLQPAPDRQWSPVRRRTRGSGSFLRHQLAEERGRLFIDHGRGGGPALPPSAAAGAQGDVERRASLLVAAIELGALAAHVIDDRVLPALRRVVENRLAVRIE